MGTSLVGHLRRLLRHRWFRWLFATRLTSQLSDGVFQVALAGYVLFSPERQPDARSIAMALAVVLLPFSVLGPFAGVLLDRWQRRQVLAYANLIRSGIVLTLALFVARGIPDWLFALVVVCCLSLNRFVLAGLSAALPHTVEADDLVTANALTPTLGALGTATGAGLGAVVHQVAGDAWVLVFAAVGYFAASLVALRIPRRLLGPDAVDQSTLGAVLHGVIRGLVQGLRHLRERRPAAYALGTIAASRFAFGLITVVTVLLYRGHFHAGEDPDAAFADLAWFGGAVALGFFAAALLTPPVVERSGTYRWMVSLLGIAGVATLGPVLWPHRPVLVGAGAVVGLGAQGVKICVDTLVQISVDDEFRGRVFSVYDVLYNGAFVASAAVAAGFVPDNGLAPGVLALAAAVFMGTATAYAASRP
ncbi:MAG: MFS transporter [Nocardioidaceae bacterium]